MDLGYIDAVAAADRKWVSDDHVEVKKPFVLRLPVSLLNKMKAAAEAESIVAGREKTVTEMVTIALTDHYADYEADHGGLPPPTVPYSDKDEPKKRKPGAVSRVPPSKAIRDYAAAVAKKRGSKEH
jgi:hypothetical protein